MLITPCCKTRHWMPVLKVDFPKDIFKCEVCNKMFDKEDFIKVEEGFNPTTFYCDKCHKSMEEEFNKKI